MENKYREIIFQAIFEVFEDSYLKYFKKSKKYNFAELAYNAIDGLEYNTEDIFYPGFSSRIQSLVSALESSKRMKIYRLLLKFEGKNSLLKTIVKKDLDLKLENEAAFNKKYPSLVGANNVKEAVLNHHKEVIQEWKDNYSKYNIIEFPYLSMTSSDQVVFRYLETDIKLFINRYNLEYIDNDKNTLLYMDGMSSVSSLYPNKKIILKEDKEITIETTTMIAKYPTIHGMDAKIMEMNIRDSAIKETILRQLNADDINTLAYVLNHMKYNLIQGETSGSLDIRDIAKQLYGYGTNLGYIKDKILKSFINLYVVDIIKDGYAFRFLSSFGYNKDIDKNKISFTIEKELSKQLLSREIYSMDANALKSLGAVSTRTLYVPLSILRMGKYLAKESTQLSDEEVLLDYLWLSSNISFSPTENPSSITKRVKESLDELIKSKLLVQSYRFVKTDFYIILKDIGKDEEAFIQQSYINNNNLLAEYLKHQSSIESDEKNEMLP